MIKTVIIKPERPDREKIASILTARKEIEVLAYGKDGYDALTLISSLKPDIALMDNKLEFIDGEEIPPLLRNRSPSTAVIILADNMKDNQLFKASLNRVLGLVCVKTDFEMLPDICLGVSRGECFISPALAVRIFHLLAGEPRKLSSAKPSKSIRTEQAVSGAGRESCLSKSEIQILTCLGKGYSSAKIAEIMELKVGTIRNYISVIMRKTGFQNRAEIASYACNSGLIL